MEAQRRAQGVPQGQPPKARELGWGSERAGGRPLPGLGEGCAHLCGGPFPVPPECQALRGVGQWASPTAGSHSLHHPGSQRPQLHLPRPWPGEVTGLQSSCRLYPKRAHRKEFASFTATEVSSGLERLRAKPAGSN